MFGFRCAHQQRVTQFRIAVENIEPYMAFCPREDAAEMIAGALNAQVPVDALAEPLTNWQLRDIAAGLGQTNTVKGVVLLDMDDILHGIETVNDLACERLAGEGGSRLQDIRYKVVGHAGDGGGVEPGSSSGGRASGIRLRVLANARRRALPSRLNVISMCSNSVKKPKHCWR